MQDFIFMISWISKKNTEKLSSIFKFQFSKKSFELKISETFDSVFFIQNKKHHICKKKWNQKLMQAWSLMIQVIENYDWFRTVVMFFFLE